MSGSFYSGKARQGTRLHVARATAAHTGNKVETVDDPSTLWGIAWENEGSCHVCVGVRKDDHCRCSVIDCERVVSTVVRVLPQNMDEVVSIGYVVCVKLSWIRTPNVSSDVDTCC